jgi:Ca2+-dependent lipid-binding protein
MINRNETFIMPVLNPNNEMILFEIRDWDFGINRDDFM